MKKQLFLAAIVALTLASCKKDRIRPTEVNVEKSGENYQHTTTYIRDHSWQIMNIYSDSQGNGVWKLQEVYKSNNYIIISPVDEAKFGAPNYGLYSILVGEEVLSLKIHK